MVTDEFQGRFSVKLNRTSQIEPLEKEVEASRQQSRSSGESVEITKPGRWVDLKVKVAQLWETNSDAISPVRLVGDETGSISL